MPAALWPQRYFGADTLLFGPNLGTVSQGSESEQQGLWNSESALVEIAAAGDMSALQHLRSRYLGRNSELAGRRRSLRELPAEQRREQGRLVGEQIGELEQALAARLEVLQRQELEQRLEAEGLDISLSGRGRPVGGRHPINLMLERICRLFREAGFREESGPEIEDEYHNFAALNIPEDHPAREMHDTFYLDSGGPGARLLLRTHTSPVQIHAMARHRPPLQIICPGRVYRRDMDPTHSPMFHQVEGLWIDRSLSLANLRSLVSDFLRRLFDQEQLPVRFRPSYFPFTEPSAEADIGCLICADGDRRNCRTCKGTGWLEVMGCGMVHPHVLTEAGLDAERWNGIAFGLGVERMAMLYARVGDLRKFYENDLRFLGRFHTL